MQSGSANRTSVTKPKRTACRHALFGLVCVLTALPMTTQAQTPRDDGAQPADTAANQRQEVPLTFRIPAQPLAAALRQFSAQSGYQLSHTQDTVAGLQSNAVTGRYPPRQALQRLLAGTGISYRVTAVNRITLESLEGEQTLPTVRVEGKGRVETAYGPVDGYVAERSASATKTDTPLIETPQSVSVVTRDQLQIQDADSLGEALRYTPGIQAETFGFEPRLTFLRIRGFDATTTGLYRDGLQLRNPNFAGSFNIEPYSAERIEIPRGPASVLYGQGSPGGLVNIISKRPTLEPQREVELEVGSFDRFEGKFDFSGPIDEKGRFSYRLTGLARESDTQVDFVEDDRLFIAPAFTFQFSDATTLTLLSQYKDDDTRSSQALPADGTLRDNPNGRIPADRFTGEPDVDRYERTDYQLGYLFEHLVSDALSLRQNARYYNNDLEDVSVFSSGFQADQRTLDRSFFGNFGELDGFAIDNQAQLAFTTASVDHKLLLGVDYQRIKADSRQSFGAAPSIDIFDPNYGAPIPPAPVFNDTETTQDQIGLYVQDQVNLTDKLIITLGGRYDSADNEADNRLTDTTTRQDDSEFSGRAGVVYLSDAGWAPYASYAESFLPAIGTDANGDAFEPETGEQYEVGVKYQPPASNSFLTLALFDLTRENFIQFDPATFLPVQTGEVRSRGVEIEGVASLANGLNIIAAYTYLDVEIKESVDPAQVGETPVQTPEHFASIFADYTLRDGKYAGLGFGAGVRYIGSNFGDVPNTLKAPSNTLLDAVVHYDWRKYRFAVNAKNLLDDDEVASCFTRGADDFCTIGQQRTIIGSIRYSWQ